MTAAPEPGDTPFPVVFVVPGKAAPQGSKRHVGNGRLVESSKAVGPWRVRIAAAGTVAMRRFGATPFTGAVRVHIRFIMPRPGNTPKVTPPAIKKTGDIDKLARAVLDALTGPVLEDDALVVELRCIKRLAEPEEVARVVITVATFP